MKIAILGSTGMLGSMLVDYLGQDFEVLGTTRQNLNALKPNLSLLADCDWVINAIGVIPQRCKDSDTLFKVNSLFPFELARLNKPVIHITTDCVFSGDKGNYTETDLYDCKEEYGMSKWGGEVDQDNVINLRCSIIGFEPEGRYSLLKWFLSQPQKASVSGYVNYFWNGITTLHFAKICKGIIQNNLSLPSIQHIVPADWVSKYKLLRIFQDTYGREDIRVNPIQQGAGLVDRRLGTTKPELNRELWNLAGYNNPPTISEMVKELSEYKVRVAV